MPFTASWIEEKLKNAAAENRLPHAFLLTGASSDELEEFFYRTAAVLLKEEDREHPDLHIVRPESKSRRIVIDQIRELQHELQLKAYRAPYKVAGIFSADRMCAGSAEPANAFLKTLEEPPAHTVIFLITDYPEGLLPTIRSRCLALPIFSDKKREMSEELKRFIEKWASVEGVSRAADAAYRRASLLSEYWQTARQQTEESFKKSLKDAEENEEAALQSRVESEVILKRDETLAALIRETWNQVRIGSVPWHEAERACVSLEELRNALARNVDQALAVERCCLKIGGLIN
jgi:DNA polymerase-3 subunit delta'